MYHYYIDDSSKEDHYCLTVTQLYIDQQSLFEGYCSFISISLLGSSCLTTTMQYFKVVLATSSQRVIHTLLEPYNTPILYYRFTYSIQLGSQLFEGLGLFSKYYNVFQGVFPKQGGQTIESMKVIVISLYFNKSFKIIHFLKN